MLLVSAACVAVAVALSKHIVCSMCYALSCLHVHGEFICINSVVELNSVELALIQLCLLVLLLLLSN